MFSTDFIFRQQENLVEKQKNSGWIQAAMQQNTNAQIMSCLICFEMKNIFYAKKMIAVYFVWFISCCITDCSGWCFPAGSAYM